MASSNSRRLSSWTGLPISSRRHGSIGIGITGCLRRPNCGGDVRLIALITEPGSIRKILTHVGEPLEPPPVSPARGPPTNWGELVQVHDDRDVFQASPDELPVIDIHSV
jgi:hypothetical protein